MGMAEMVPVWEKANLTLEEAAAYFGIGINKLRDLTNEESCPFVLWSTASRGFAPFFHPVTVPEDFTPTSAATTFGAFPILSHKATYLLQNIKISYRKSQS